MGWIVVTTEWAAILNVIGGVMEASRADVIGGVTEAGRTDVKLAIDLDMP